jgi:hypothetical protein
MSKPAESRLRSKLALPLSLLILFLVLTGFSYAYSTVAAGNIHRQKEYLVNSLEHYITDCYASKGYYPISLNYLKENYNLTYNDQLFYIDYQVRGANIRPDVAVIELNDSDA